MQKFEKLAGYRTVIVNGALLGAGLFRPKYPGIPDEQSLIAGLDAILGAVVSLPGAALINVALRIFLTSTKFKWPWTRAASGT